MAGIEVQEGDDCAGTRGGIASLPDLHGSAYADIRAGNHSVRWTTRYIAGVDDVRPSVPGAFREIGSFMTHDLVYCLQLPAAL